MKNRTELQEAKGDIVICLLLALCTLAVYWPVVGFEFVNLDDPVYVTGNGQVQAGLTGASLVWAFTTQAAEFWHPLTWLSHMLDVQLYGLRAGGHHLTSLLLHLANTLLLFLVLKRMTAWRWRSAMVAALFALHPLHVESVAWVADRKDVLSTLFWMLTLWAYGRYAEVRSAKCEARSQNAGAGGKDTRGGGRNTAGSNPRPSPLDSQRFNDSTTRRFNGWYVLTLVFFALGLMSKPMVVTLPFVLLLLDWWPLRRFDLTALIVQRSTLVRLVVEKMPFFLLAILGSVVAFVAQERGGVLPSLEQFPARLRIANALVSYVRYLGKTIWPSDLAVFYPHPGLWPWWQVAGALLLLLGISAMVVRAMSKRPYLAVGWLWFVGTLVPVIGLVQVGSHAMADRYTYIPLIGVFVAVVWGVAELGSQRLSARWGIRLLSAAVLLGCGCNTWFQLQHWRNSITLLEHTAAVTTDNAVAHSNLGVALVEQGRAAEAIRHYEAALRIRPGYVEARNNLGLALAQQGRVAEAIAHYQEALRQKPDDPNVHFNLGLAWFEQGRLPEAIREYEEVLRLNPKHVGAHNGLGMALFKLGKVEKAMEHFERVLSLKPDDPLAHNGLGVALFQRGQVMEAAGHLQEALRTKPDYAEAHFNLGVVHFQAGKMSEAITHFEQALRSKPNNAEAHYNWGVALCQQGRFPEAIGHFEQALRIKPDHADARINLGNALRQQGRVSEAIAQYEQVLRLQPGNAEARFNLGSAFAVQGRWEDAIQTYQRIVETKPDNVEARRELALALRRRARFAEAVAHYEKILELEPRSVLAHNELAWLLATCTNAAVRNGGRATELAQRAEQLTEGKNPAILDTLAAAQAEAGSFSDAVRLARQALALAQAAGQTNLTTEIQSRLQLYQSQRAYREP